MDLLEVIRKDSKGVYPGTQFPLKWDIRFSLHSGPGYCTLLILDFYKCYEMKGPICRQNLLDAAFVLLSKGMSLKIETIGIYSRLPCGLGAPEINEEGTW
jgi:hypothetical protein